MANGDTLQLQYNKALRYYLLTKYSHAASTCVKAFDQLSTATEKQDDSDALGLQLWLLYINIIATSLPTSTAALTPRLAKQFGLPSTSIDSIDHFCLAVWNRLVIDCGNNIAGNCDPRLVCAYLLMTLKRSIPMVGRQVAEQWFATLPETIIDHLSSIQEKAERESDMLWTAYLQLVDLYAARILPETGDFESARSFVEYNSFLSDEKKEILFELIQHGEDDQQRETERKKRLEQQQKEEAEAAAKLAVLEKQRQEQNARELQQRKKREAALQQQKQQQQQQQQQLQQQQQEQEQEQQRQQKERSISSTSSFSTRSQPVAQQRSPKTMSDQSLTVVKTWIQRLRATGSAASVAILVIFFALLGLLRGPRGYLTNALKSIMEKLWQTAKMGTKVTYM